MEGLTVSQMISYDYAYYTYYTPTTHLLHLLHAYYTPTTPTTCRLAQRLPDTSRSDRCDRRAASKQPDTPADVSELDPCYPRVSPGVIRRSEQDTRCVVTAASSSNALLHSTRQTPPEAPGTVGDSSSHHPIAARHPSKRYVHT